SLVVHAVDARLRFGIDARLELGAAVVAETEVALGLLECQAGIADAGSAALVGALVAEAEGELVVRHLAGWVVGPAHFDARLIHAVLGATGVRAAVRARGARAELRAAVPESAVVAARVSEHQVTAVGRRTRARRCRAYAR